MSDAKQPLAIVLMGVSGCGKSTVGAELSRLLGWPFRDADSFHPPANIEKMSQAIPLTDDDRWPWLRALRVVIEQALADGTGAVVPCSALKQAYRDVLSGGLSNVHYVHLTGDPNVLAARLAGRRGHFMNPALLESQIAALEPPLDALEVDVSRTPAEQVAAIRQALSL